MGLEQLIFTRPLDPCPSPLDILDPLIHWLYRVIELP